MCFQNDGKWSHVLGVECFNYIEKIVLCYLFIFYFFKFC